MRPTSEQSLAQDPARGKVPFIGLLKIAPVPWTALGSFGEVGFSSSGSVSYSISSAAPCCHPQETPEAC